MPQKEFPTVEYPKDEKELIIRQWDRVLRLGSSSKDPMEIINAVDLLEVSLSDKIDNPNDGTWKKQIKDIEDKMFGSIKGYATRRNIPVDELKIDQQYPIMLQFYKKKMRILWMLTTVKGTFGVKLIKGVLDENVIATLSESTKQ